MRLQFKMEKDKSVLAEICDVVTRLPELRFKSPVNWRINHGEHWAVVGPNGSGKSLLAGILQRKYAMKEGEVRLCNGARIDNFIRSITFRDIYSLADCRTSYYQQRWNTTESDEMPTVEELLKEHQGSDNLSRILDLFGIKDLLPKRLIYLSSGELRKFLIVRTLLKNPQILILDNPFIGLDSESRGVLVEMLEVIGKLHGVHVILLLSNPSDIPEMITNVMPMLDRDCLPPLTREEFLANRELIGRLFPTESEGYQMERSALPVDNSSAGSIHDVTMRMEKVSIRYGNRTILRDIDWEIRNGEKWSLSGPNGSGKSTLLSLVYADNPQSYANTIYLFDKRRGSGESIWDIKRRIGYVSPEMHLYYKENVSALRVVSSGFFDSVGLYRKCDVTQEELALEWMRLFGIDGLRDRMFLSLSSGEQRLALLARAFVKDPDLLILDEPLHGLDISRKKMAADIIERFCSRNGKTLIYVTHYPHELPCCIDKHFELRKID